MFKTIFGHWKSSCLMAGPLILVPFQNRLISFSSKQVALIPRSCVGLVRNGDCNGKIRGAVSNRALHCGFC